MVIKNKLTRNTLLILFVTVIFQLLVVGSSFADTTLYDFESGEQSWVHQTWDDSQACTSVNQSGTQKYEGDYSLEMNMDLIGGHANNSKGEAYVDRGDTNLIDLLAEPFACWIYCPTGSEGDPSKPNGIQIFFKDSEWKSWYGPWNNIGDDIPLDTWTKVEVTIGPTPPDHEDPGFNAINIRVMGVKMGAGGSSTATYNDSIYVDYLILDSGDITPPGPPTGISVSDPGTGGTLNVSWANPTDTDFDYIRIYRSTSSGSIGSLIANNQTGISYQDTGLTNGQLYYYTLRSVDTSNNESNNTDQHSGTPTSGSVGTRLFDWESGTLEDWDLDCEVGLTNTTDNAYHGTHSIHYGLTTTGGRIGYGTDYVEAYILWAPDRDLIKFDGIDAYIYISSDINIGETINAYVTMRASPHGWYKGTAFPITNANLDTWHKINFDFSISGPISRQHISGIGVYLEGGNGSSGTGQVYIDNVILLGENDTTPPDTLPSVWITNPGTGGTLDINWVNNPSDTECNHIHIYRSTTAGVLGTLVHDNVSPTIGSLQDTGLTNGVEYFYTLRTVDHVDNESTNTDQHSGTPTAGDTTPPAPPTNISVTDPATGGTLNLSWTNPTDTDFNHIHIYRSTTSGVLGSLIADNQTGTSYQDIGLINGQTYYYTLRSVDDSGNESTNTDQHSGIPTFQDTTPPAPPTNISVVDSEIGGQLYIYWTNPTDSDFNHIHIYRSITGGVLGSLIADNQTGTNYQDTGLTNGQIYYYTLRSVDNSDNESSNTDQYSGIPTIDPSGRTCLYDFETGTQNWTHQIYTDSQACTSVTQSSIQRYEGTYSLQMNMNLEGGHANNSKGESYVDVGEGTEIDLDGVPFDLWVYCPAGSEGNPSLPNGIQIFFKDSSWDSWYGPWQNVQYDIPLDTWTELEVTLGTTTPDYVGPGDFDATSIRMIGIKIATGGGSLATYNDPVYVDYVYTEGGDTTPPGPPTGISVTNPGTGGILNLSWTNPTDSDFNHIHIYRSTSSGALGSLIADNQTGTSYQDTGLTNGQIYYYTLRSVDDSDNESTNTDQHSGTPTGGDTTPPAPPTDIYVVDAQIGGQLNISWMNPLDGDFDHIHIYRSTTNGVLGSLVYDDIVGTSLADAGLTNGQTYYYTLRSVDTSSNESTNTDQHSGVPSLVTITALFDFEDGTTQGWVNDTSIYFRNNLGTPYNTTSRHNTGTHSLAFPLNFDDKDPVWGTINDTAYVIPAAPYDLSSRTGISVYIYIAHTGFQYDAPPCGTVYVKTGSDWNWFESEDYVNIPWSYDCGNFRRITINFSSAKNDDGDIVAVTNLDDVKEIGFHISGASTGSGSSTLYLDTVRLNGGTGDTTPPSPPTSITVTDTQMGGELYLTWINPPDVDFDHVNIYRSEVSGQLGVWIRQCANNVNSYLDAGLINGTQYYYTLRSVDTSVNESTNTDQHSGVPTMASVLSLYDFEDGTRQGWVNDTTGDFADNLGTPSNSTAQAQEGTHSLCYPLNLDVKDPVWNCINDAGYVRPSPPENLSTANGIALYMYIPDTADISGSTPACSSVYLKTGSDWKWFESDEMVDLTLGVWNRITINFLSARDDTGAPGQTVTDLDNIKEIGIHISGAATSSGNTLLYIDNVVAVGAEPETELSVSITGSYNFGTLELGDEVISNQALTVTNTGNITETFSLNLVDPSGWTAVQTDPDDEIYVLNGMFNSTQPVAVSFVENNHALSIIPQQCTLNKFAGDQTGVGISSSDTRSLWVEFRAPTMTAIVTPQTIRLIITAEAS